MRRLIESFGANLGSFSISAVVSEVFGQRPLRLLGAPKTGRFPSIARIRRCL